MEATGKTVISGGDIILQDGSEGAAEAVVVEDGRVLASGSARDMNSLAGGGARRYDLEGATLMPGIVDSHPHFLHFAAFEVACVNILDATDHDDIVARIAKKAQETPEGQWIITTPVGEPHYFIRRWYKDLKERRMPDRKVLDRATTRHPVLIQAWAPRTPNIVSFNSLGLREAGISSITPDQVCSVRIEKDDSGVPTGVLRGPVVNYYTEDPFWLQILSKLPPPPNQLWELGALEGQRLAAKLGVTSCYEAHGMDPEHILAYKKVRDSGKSTMRVLTAMEIVNGLFDPHWQPTNEEVIERLATAAALQSTDDDFFRHRGATLARGGPCWPGFLRIHDEMKNPDGHLTRGKTFVTKEIEELVIDYCLKNDLRLNMVQGGYRDQDDFFDSLSSFEGDYDIPSRNWISQHNILITESHCEKLARLNMDITTSVSFVWGKGDMYGERIGESSWRDLVPLKRMVDSGANVACGSDWGPKNIFHHIALAETHEFAASGYRNDTADHKLNRQESLATWTTAPAKIMQWEGIGSLANGCFADMVVVDRNPLTTSNEDLEGTQVLKTVVGGKSVYETSALTKWGQL
ncbi:Amidohydrolase family protein [Luminiphilus syltensis NOR5-1B]|uniref:Amidohydrolase family protein n=1 Tax=Luminiphilus syltensis NOR5-1B TaxID=565045 RepID=B8KY07_9GAMM|nr:amidohydrolase family protein [Luminiphilus syltensis]EED35590.1 Amidohydrolase family protein [Luminiphilus syltensis NOR5-1B]